MTHGQQSRRKEKKREENEKEKKINKRAEQKVKRFHRV